MKKALFWVVAAAVVGGTFLAGHFLTREEMPAESPSVPVEVIPVEVSDIESVINTTGIVEAMAVVRLMPKVGGRLERLAVRRDGTEIPVEEGLLVEAGEPVGLIDRELYEAELARAAAAVGAAEAGVQSARVEIDDAAREHRRITALFESGSVTEQARDRAVAALDAANARVALAQAQLGQARAAAELAEINLRESILVSPIRGVVLARHVDRGNLISPGQTVLTIADLETVKIIVTVADRHESSIRPGMTVRISVDASPGKVFQAQVHSVYPVLDEQTRSLKAEIRRDNADAKLRPGMFARAAMVAERKEGVIVVQRDAVLGMRLGDPYVYVVEDGRARRREVAIGVRQGDMVEITSGLEAGESLVTAGMTYLEDGGEVRIVRLEDVR